MPLIVRLRLSGHGARHEASNIYAIERIAVPVINRPNHRPPNLVRLGYHCLSRYIPPFILDANAIVAIFGFPIRVQHDTAVGIGATGALATCKLLKPCPRDRDHMNDLRRNRSRAIRGRLSLGVF